MRPDSEIRDAIVVMLRHAEKMLHRNQKADSAIMRNNVRYLIWAIGDESDPVCRAIGKFLEDRRNEQAKTETGIRR